MTEAELVKLLFAAESCYPLATLEPNLLMSQIV